MRVPRAKKLIALSAAIVASGSLVAIAGGAVLMRESLADGTDLRYRFERVVTDASGFDSGWHIHPGLVIVQIEAGSVQFTQGSCTAKTYGPGDTIFEVPWKAARFVSSGAAVWTTTFLVPSRQQLTVPMSAYTPQRANPCP